MINGFLNLNKPCGVTSYDVIREIKHIKGIKKIGHTGTLDPIASGVLIIALNNATRLIEYLPKGNKVYEALLNLGQTSDTYDTEGKIQAVIASKAITESDFEKVLKKYHGEVFQTPPIFSAVKSDGKRAYELARKGEKPRLKERKVTISEIQVLEFYYPKARIRVSCSSGTYIRTLIHDIGQDLEVGAIMSGLTRVENSGMKLADACEIGEITNDSLENHLISPYKLFKEKTLILNEKQISDVRLGRYVTINTDKDIAIAFSNNQELVALLKRMSGNTFKPDKVFVK